MAADERERRREVALRVNEPGIRHLPASSAKAPHELQMEQDSDRDHRDSEPDERGAKIPRCVRVREEVGVFQVLKELVDREAEADERGDVRITLISVRSALIRVR